MTWFGFSPRWPKDCCKIEVMTNRLSRKHLHHSFRSGCPVFGRERSSAHFQVRKLHGAALTNANIVLSHHVYTLPITSHLGSNDRSRTNQWNCVNLQRRKRIHRTLSNVMLMIHSINFSNYSSHYFIDIKQLVQYSSFFNTFE